MNRLVKTIFIMKTKQLKFLSFLAVILALSCSVDELENNSTLETESLLKDGHFTEQSESTELSSQKLNSNDSQLNVSGNSTSGLNGGEADVIYLYINMDGMEEHYNSDPTNPSYEGSFNDYYRSLMGNHYTIYSYIQSTDPDCGNMERWRVDLEEYNAYRESQGQTTTDPNNNTNGTNSSNATNTNNTGVADSNGNNEMKKKGPPDPDDDDLIGTEDYGYCFSE